MHIPTTCVSPLWWLGPIWLGNSLMSYILEEVRYQDVLQLFFTVLCIVLNFFLLTGQKHRIYCNHSSDWSCTCRCGKMVKRLWKTFIQFLEEENAIEVCWTVKCNFKRTYQGKRKQLTKYFRRKCHLLPTKKKGSYNLIETLYGDILNKNLYFNKLSTSIGIFLTSKSPQMSE